MPITDNNSRLLVEGNLITVSYTHLEYYQITRIDDHEGYKTDIDLYCKTNPEQHPNKMCIRDSYYTVTGWSGSKGAATQFNKDDYYWTMGKCLEVEDVIKKHCAIKMCIRDSLRLAAEQTF